MEYYSAIKNGIMSCAGKWIELESLMLSKRRQAQKSSITCSCLFVKPKPNMMMMMMMMMTGHECEEGGQSGGIGGKVEEGKGKDS
jgi:hypothetical protein